MLNLTIKPGEYFVIGDDIRVIFAGGTANNARVMIDAPRSYNIVRGKVLEQEDMDSSERNSGSSKSAFKAAGQKKKYYVEPEISKERMESFLKQQQARAAE